VAVGKDTTLEIFDPEYFVAFEFPGEHPLTLTGAPAGCTGTYHPPKGLDDQTMAILNSLPMDQRQLPPDLAAAADNLADMFTVDCPVVEAAAPAPPPEAPRATGKSPFGIATPDGGSGMNVGGPFGPVFAWIAARQSEFYRTLTQNLGAIKENGGAVWLLFLVAFLYGVFHAAGPGHGKAVITSYILASGDSVRRGVAISFAAAFVQALSAGVFVGVATLIIGATAQQITGVTDWLEVASYGAITLLGVWLLWSKIFRRGHHHHHHHHGGLGDDHDGHHHAGNGRRLERRDLGAAAATGPQDLDALAAERVASKAAEPFSGPVCEPATRNWFVRAWSANLSVGIRPCSGAIIILVIALSQGLLAAGVAATFVMALGTGLTVAVLAAIAVSAKGLAMRFADAESGRGAVVLRTVEIGGALAVFLFGLLLLGGALYPMM
jgi:ABC-type nickel/cobalt efflux system permease component RcnA